jgi:AmmeMemoRadiSam system protein A
METQIPQDQREALLDLARQGVEARVLQKPPEIPSDPQGALKEKRGCFVTLTNEGNLRGCIGTFMPQFSLARQIVEMGQAAAQDPRFVMDPVTPDELDRITIEVSVLSPLEKTETPEKLLPGKHGIYVVQGARSGCFLPEVATDQDWNAEEFLSYCCAHKAGLPPDAWREAHTQVYLFTSEKFRR